MPSSRKAQWRFACEEDISRGQDLLEKLHLDELEAGVDFVGEEEAWKMGLNVDQDVELDGDGKEPQIRQDDSSWHTNGQNECART